MQNEISRRTSGYLFLLRKELTSMARTLNNHPSEHYFNHSSQFQNSLWNAKSGQKTKMVRGRLAPITAASAQAQGIDPRINEIPAE